MRIFVDTNIIISAILFPKSKVAEAFAYILKAHHLIISNYIIDELEQVFNDKFAGKTQMLNNFLENLTYELVDVEEPIDIAKYPKMRDEYDLPILAAAIESTAEVFVTGDKDFDDIETEGLEILKPADFIEKYGKGQ